MTVSTLRPNGTSANTGALTGGATAHAVLNDNSDASYDTFDVGEGATLTLDDFTLPAGSAVTSIAVRLRTAKAIADPCNLRVTLNVGANSYQASVGVTWLGAQTSTFLTQAGAFADADIDAATLVLAAISGDSVKVYEAYVDVSYTAPPTVTITSPSGTVTTDDTPTVQWTPTLDAEAGAQTHYRAVYMANGEHPDTHTPIADSGIVASDDTSWAPSASLANATYDLYVKVAQTVNGSQLWSDWDDQQDVVLNIPAPATPTSLTVTAESSSGRVKLEVAEGSGGTVITDRYRFQRSTDAGSTWEDVRTDEGGGIFLVPTVVGAVAATADAADATSHVVTLPVPASGILEDDLLIAFVAMDGNPSVSWPAGWTEIKDEAGNGSAVRVACAWKRAAGGESGSITVTTSASEGGAVHILCVRGAHPTTAPAISTGANGSTTSGDPDSLDPGNWGTENTLWIAAVGNDGNVAINSGPTGYFGFLNTRWANASGAGVATAIKRSAASSADPGAFTLASAEDTRAFTVGVRPDDASPIVYDYEGGNGESVMYRVQAIHDFSSGTSSSSAWVTSGATSWTSTASWVKSASRPDLNLIVVLYSQPGHNRPARDAVFEPLGRPDAVVISDTRGSKRGQITFIIEDEDDIEQFEELLDLGEPLLIQTTANDKWPDRWVKLRDLEATRFLDKSWGIEGLRAHEWIEVAAPEAPLP